MFCVLPVIIVFYALLTNSLISKEAGSYMVAGVEMYGCVNSLITLRFVRPYRQFVVNLLLQGARWLSCGRACRDVRPQHPVTLAVSTYTTTAVRGASFSY